MSFGGPERGRRVAEAEGGVQRSRHLWRKWTLNWSEVTPDILVGSCPRTPQDIDTLVSEAGVSAVLSLQSDDCIASLALDVPALKARCLDANVLHARLGIRDFDRDDATAMLPDAVRALAALLGAGRRVYVHCTAGINRAPLTVVGYLVFVKGWLVDDAVAAVKKSRPIANPYLDTLYAAKGRMLHGRNDELTALSRALYEARQGKPDTGKGTNDWFDAEDQVIQRLFARRATTDAETLAALAAATQKHGGFVRGPTAEETALATQLAEARKDGAEQTAALIKAAADEKAALTKAASEAAAAAAAELARVQAEGAAALAAAQKAGADALAAANLAAAEAAAEAATRSAADLAAARKDAADAALAAAAALDSAQAAAAAALAAAAEQAAAELDAAAAAAQRAQEVAATQIQGALDAADVQSQASAARQAVLEREVRRLADSAAAAARFDAEAAARKSELEMAAVDMVKASAAEVLRMREATEALRRELTDVRAELAETRTALVLAEGKAPVAAAAARVAAMAQAAQSSNGNGAAAPPAPPPPVAAAATKK